MQFLLLLFEILQQIAVLQHSAVDLLLQVTDLHLVLRSLQKGLLGVLQIDYRFILLVEVVALDLLRRLFHHPQVVATEFVPLHLPVVGRSEDVTFGLAGTDIQILQRDLVRHLILLLHTVSQFIRLTTDLILVGVLNL
jgi:hypothetical protein